MHIYIYTVFFIHMKKKSLQVKGVSQKLKNSAFVEEIQSIHIKVPPKMHKYVKNYSQRKLAWSRYGAVQSFPEHFSKPTSIMLLWVWRDLQLLKVFKKCISNGVTETLNYVVQKHYY